MLKRLVFVACVALAAVVLASPTLAESSEFEAATWQQFDELVTTAKKSMMVDPRAALESARAAEAVASRVGSSSRQTDALATSLWLEGEAYMRINRTADARTVIERAIVLANRDGKTTKLDGDLALSLARIGDNNADVGLALKSYQRAHDIFARLGLARSLSIALQGLGGIYDEAHDFPHEINYYRRASQVYSEDPALELSAANNIGFALQQLGRYDESIKNLHRALAISITLNSPFLRANVLTNLADVYAKQHRFVDAQKAADQALLLFGKKDESGGAPFVWGIKAEIEYERGRLDAAADDLAIAFRGVNLTTTISPFRDIHMIAYKVYRAKGNSALALAHFEAFKRLDDQGRSLSTSANLALMGAQFDFTTQQLEIEHLKSEQLKRDISLRESRAVVETVIFSALLLVGVLLILWLGWRHLLVRRHRASITKANIELTDTLRERNIEIVRRVAVESQLRTAMETAEQANLAKSHFLANMSHELRTPLNAIIGFSELMASGAIALGKCKEYAADIHVSGRNLLAILNTILDMARIDAGRVTLDENIIPIGLLVTDVLRDVTENTRGNKSIRYNGIDSGLRVRGDEHRLHQILGNLLSNAIKFTGDDGVVEVCVEPVADGVDFTVSDNGCGIPEDKLALVMEPFGQVEGAYARWHGGVGLGLPIVKALVELHGGRITIESEVNKGTLARVHLPTDRLSFGPPIAAAIA